MNNLFLEHYGWVSGTWLKADATKVGREVKALSGDRSELPRPELIAAGVGGSGEIAKCFTQDRDEAAQKRWEDEADYLMRCLVPIIIDTQTEEEHSIDQRVWVPVYKQTGHAEDSGVYRHMPVVVSPLPPEPKLDPQMRGWVALMAWVDRYGDDPLFASIVAAVEALKN